MQDDNVLNSLLGWVNEVLTGLHSIFFRDVVTAIIPAYNEEKTIKKVIKAVKKSMVDEIIVVDDGSTDKTFRTAKKEGVNVVRHKNNMGKGAAMRTGLKNARGNIIVFIDGDLKSLDAEKVNMLIGPILKNEADFVKSYFYPYKTKTGYSIFLYKPLIKYLFDTTGFVHPVSGQIAGRKNFFNSIEFRNDYGTDISILIDAIKHNLRIKEVCLGQLLHKKRTIKEVELIADMVIRTILEKAGIFKQRI